MYFKTMITVMLVVILIFQSIHVSSYSKDFIDIKVAYEPDIDKKI